MARHEKVQIWKKYDIEGERVKRKGQSCPRCGEGVFLAEHGTRVTCGRCGYSEIKKEK